MGLLEGRAGSKRHHWKGWSGMCKVFLKDLFGYLGS